MSKTSRAALLPGLVALAGLALVSAATVGTTSTQGVALIDAVRRDLPSNGADSPMATRVGLLRTDQAGYLPSDTKLAYLMSPGALKGERFSVSDDAGTTVQAGDVPSGQARAWNASYKHVYRIDLSGITTPGHYTLSVAGPLRANSAPLSVVPQTALYMPLVSDGVNFFENQRDGEVQVLTDLHRQPSHLNDQRATVYEQPKFIAGSDGGSGDRISGDLIALPGAAPVNVEGGWFDAGDYLKFTFTAAYADDLLYESALSLGASSPASLDAEAQYGTDWLARMWNPATKTLYLQVGIGAGNETTYLGDHDLWRLPQADDSDKATLDYFAAAHRPVFEAAPPGGKIAPDLAGRVAAAFALASRFAALHSDTASASNYLNDATTIYELADTSAAENSRLTSTLPEAYYPEGIWHDAMEFAASEISLAEETVSAPATEIARYLEQAGRFAALYISKDSGVDSLNLYDVSALAHSELIAALTRDPGVDVTVTTTQLLSDMRSQLARAAATAANSAFNQGGDSTTFDVDSHTFGFVATEALYEKAGGDRSYATFAAEQRDWLFGSNPWGYSFMVGVGSTFPDCTASQIPNLAGTLNGLSPVDTGAVVNGPNAESTFQGGLGGLLSGMRACGNDKTLEALSGHDSEFVDDVRSWQADEPADDMTAAAILAAATQASIG